MGRLHVVGYLSIDSIELPASRHPRLPGGAALYAALAGAASGADVVLHACAGADFDAEWLSLAARSGIDLSHVVRVPGPARRARLAYLDGDCRRSVTHGDPEWWARTAALAPTPPGDLAAGDVVALAPLPAALASVILETARAAGARVVADTSVAFAARERDAVLALAAAVDAFVPSVDETRLLRPRQADDDAARACAPRAGALLQKRGSAGALLIEPGGHRTWLPAPPADAVDPTGAGDAVLGAFAAGLLADLPAIDAARAALAMGARAIGAPGPFGLIARSAQLIRT